MFRVAANRYREIKEDEMSDCIFCKLANGEISTRTVYEDDKFRVIMDAAPATRGHSLILPKAHYANIYEMPEDLAADAMRLAKKMAAHMTEKLGCDGFNLVQNNGEAAGQTVFHFHLHLIPRYAVDNDPSNVNWSHIEQSDDEMDEICKTINC